MATNRANEVLDYMRSRKERMIALLRTLVEAESPSSQPTSHEPVRRALENAIGACGFVVRDVVTRTGYQHLYARPARRERHAASQLVVGHYDTVWPVGTGRERPFTVDGNEIRGPGVFDMKGGLVQIILALEAFRDLDLVPKLTPV